jgi:poly-gamma-glutamate capsule biosynthesis protein CapA/YwtB (metallophosphatase superfamily)
MRSILFKARRGAAGIPGAVLVVLLAAPFAWLGCESSRTVQPAAGASGRPQEQPRPSTLRPVPASAPGVTVMAQATIAAAGDVLMHDAVKQTAAQHRTPENDEGFGWLWAPVADLLSSADVTFANLETPIAPRSGRRSRSFVFNAPPTVLHALRRAGVSLVSVANNHVFDQGRAGFEETLRQLEAAGMPYVGAGEAGHESGPRFVEANGLRLAFLAYAHFFNQPGNDCLPPGSGGGEESPGRGCVRASLLDPERAVADVRAAAREADAVIVSLHWGNEYQRQPREADAALAHRLVDAGALIVLGHHPHVLQPIELVTAPDGRTALVAYSLGNFISNQSRRYVHGVTPAEVGATRDGILLRATVAKRDYGRGVVRVELGSVAWWPLWTENDTTSAARRGRPAIRVVSLDRELAAVRAAIAAMPQPVAPGDRARYVRLRQREELYVARRAAIAATVGEDLQAEAPPGPPSGRAAPATEAPAR